jgi:GTPase SAR1 family protein
MDSSFEDSFLNVVEFQRLFGPSSSQEKYILKLAIVGYPGTGKSSFIKRFCDQVFLPDHIPSLHTEITSESIKLSNSCIIEVFLYEIAGQTQYIDLKDLFVRGIQGVIILFAPHYAYSFERVPFLVNFIDSHMIAKVPKLIAGNSFAEKRSLISPDRAEELSKTLGIPYLPIDVKRVSRSVDKCIWHFIKELMPELDS